MQLFVVTAVSITRVSRIWKCIVTFIFITFVRTHFFARNVFWQTSTWRLTSAFDARALDQFEQGFWCIRYLTFYRNKLAVLDASTMSLRRWHYRVGPFILCPYQWLGVCTFHSWYDRVICVMSKYQQIVWISQKGVSSIFGQIELSMKMRLFSRDRCCARRAYSSL